VTRSVDAVRAVVVDGADRIGAQAGTPKVDSALAALMGAAICTAKAVGARDAIANGAEEASMVIDVGALLGSTWESHGRRSDPEVSEPKRIYEINLKTEPNA